MFRLRSKFFTRTESNAEATTEFTKQPTVRSPPRPPTSILYSLTPSTKVYLFVTFSHSATLFVHSERFYARCR